MPNFLIRRSFKIWPTYFLYLAYIALVMSAMDLQGETRLEALRPGLVHLQNYWRAVPHGGHLWSLAVEEHFYLTLPILLGVVAAGLPGTDRLRRLPAIALLIMVSCLCMRTWIASTTRRLEELDWFSTYAPTHLRVDALIFGVLLAYLHSSSSAFRDAAARHRAPLAALGLALTVPAMIVSRMDPWFYSLGLTALYLGYGALLIAAVSTPATDGVGGWIFGSRLARLVAFAGISSYSIYLWHAELALRPIGLIAGRPSSLPVSLWWAILLVVYLALAVLSGFASNLLIERPMLWLRDRVAPSTRASGPVRTPDAAETHPGEDARPGSLSPPQPAQEAVAPA